MDEDELTADFFLVTLENTQFFHGTYVEYANGLISRRARYQVSIRRPCEGLDGVFVIMPVPKLRKPASRRA